MRSAICLLNLMLHLSASASTLAIAARSVSGGERGAGVTAPQDALDALQLASSEADSVDESPRARGLGALLGKHATSAANQRAKGAMENLRATQRRQLFHGHHSHHSHTEPACKLSRPSRSGLQDWQRHRHHQ